MDASVAVKWMMPSTREPLREEAVHLAKMRSAGQLDFIVPDFFWIELGNVLWKAVRSSRVSAQEFEAAQQLLQTSDIRSFPSRQLLPSALLIALEFNRTVYDSLYVALAKDASVQLITADEKLVNAVGSRLPVVWLGSASALSF